MKKIFTFLFILSLSFSNICYSQSGWFWQNPLPQGNNLRSVNYLNPDLIYIVGDAGVCMKSTNSGLNWTINYFVGWETNEYNMCSYFLNETTGFIGTGNYTYNRILRTSNGGNTWDSVTTNNFPAFKTIFFINNFTGWSCSNINDMNVVLKTTNSGYNWFTVSTSLKPIYSVFFLNPDTGWFVGSYSLGYPANISAYYIYKTTNGGSNFISQLYTGTNNTLKTVYFINNNTGWAGGTKLWMTSNSGNIWNSYNISANSISFIDNQTGYCVNDSGVLKSSNGGTIWSYISTIGGLSISVLNTQYLAVVGKYGVISKTTDGGNNWISLSQCITDDNVNNLTFVNENTGFAISHLWSYPPYEPNIILKTTDKGFHWSYNFVHHQYDLDNIFFVDDLTGWFTGTNGLIYKTINTGINWNQQNSNTNVELLKVFFINQNTGWALGDTCILRTNNGGLNWYRIDFTEQFLLHSMHCKLLFLNSNTGFIAGIGGGIGRTTNGGNNWVQVSNISMIDIDKDSLNNLFSINSGEFFKSTNLGLNWQLVSSPGNSSEALKMINASTGYMVCSNGYILKTVNGGLNWALRKLNTNAILRSLYIIDSNKCWVSGDGGLIMSTVGSGIIGNISISYLKTPVSLSLSQNYPNPFNPVTRIKYDVPSNVKSEKSNVKIIVYDILGREIETLVNESATGGQKPGSYEVTWDGSRYASGVYFYRLITDEYVETKKMVLIK